MKPAIKYGNEMRKLDERDERTEDPKIITLWPSDE
jgi:hypothetical protein